MCIGKILIFINHEFYIENDRSTDAHVGWYVKNLAYIAGEVSGLLVSTVVFA